MTIQEQVKKLLDLKNTHTQVFVITPRFNDILDRHIPNYVFESQSNGIVDLEFSKKDFIKELIQGETMNNTILVRISQSGIWTEKENSNDIVCDMCKNKLSKSQKNKLFCNKCTVANHLGEE